MNHVEGEFEIHMKDRTQIAFSQNPFELHIVGYESVVECDDELLASLPFCLEYATKFLLVGRDRFLHDHITAEFHGPDDVFVMKAIDSGDDDSIRLCFGQHFVEIVKRRKGSTDLLPDNLTSVRVDIKDPDDFARLGIVVDDRLDEHVEGSPAGPGKGVSFHAGQFRDGLWDGQGEAR